MKCCIVLAYFIGLSHHWISCRTPGGTEMILK